MSITALHLYEQLTEASDEKARAKIIAEAFGQLEEHYPQLKEVATQGQVRESELRLQKEVEGVRLEIKQAEGRLQKEIEGVRLEIKEVEGKLQKEIEGVRLEIKGVEIKLQQTEIRLLGAIHRQTFWVIGSVGTIIGFIRLLDWLLVHIPR
ncbi:hypothetical protein [Methylococcus sp. EFPC2]|uniref:hypothetical protein n=1 Tax=Methylococcus sp. EFPC2 TaxID=2812648 RepID=UPI001967BB2F|nr:hypothetical protein [Methylococcus sp. EFPC2]QSA97628.1 hypothetical protein JWZ97_01945 [Methylococcus sp. EFPC2]